MKTDRTSSECAAARSAIVAVHHRVAQHTARLVVGWASSHVRSSLHHQLHGIHALDCGGAMEASGTALLRHRDAVVWAGRWDRQPNRDDTTARALVARMAYHAARADGPLLRPRPVPSASLRTGRGAHRTTASSRRASPLANEARLISTSSIQVPEMAR